MCCYLLGAGKQMLYCFASITAVGRTHGSSEFQCKTICRPDKVRSVPMNGQFLGEGLRINP